MVIVILFIVGLAIFAAIIAIIAWNYEGSADQDRPLLGDYNVRDGSRYHAVRRYFYSRKDHLMTDTEWRFYERLTQIAADRYYVFPQIHLSSLLKNEARGKYYKLAFQRINRWSVDFVLCDLKTRK